MAAPVVEIEVRWRRVGETAWRKQRFPPDAEVITLTGLQRGVAYEGTARSLGPRGESSRWVPVDFVVASESSTPIDQLVLDLDIEAGTVTVDCTLTRFRLTLNANVADWRFENVPQAKTITIEIEQWTPGSHTIAWPATVVPVSGRPHVMTTTVGAVDLITLSTTDQGKTWRLSAGQALPSVGGVLGVTVAPNPATATVTTDGTTATAPSVALAATIVHCDDPCTVAWSRIDTNGGNDFDITDATSTTPTLSAPSGTTAYNKAQTWRCSVTDASGAVAYTDVPVTLARTLTGGLQVTISPSPVYGSGPSSAQASATAYVTGGSGARTIAWRRVDANGGPNFMCSNPSSPSTTWSIPAGLTPITRSQTWRCDVSDSSGATFDDAEVTLERTGSS